MHFLTLISAFVGLANGMNIDQKVKHHDTDPVRLLYQYPEGTWIENIAVRPSGELLLTILTAPHLDQLNPLRPNATPDTVHVFPAKTSVSGIGEVAHDVFAMAVGNFSLSSGESVGWGVSTLDLSGGKAIVRSTVEMPEVSFLDGLCALPAAAVPGSVLAGEIKTGKIWRVDPVNGRYDVAIYNSLTASTHDPVYGVSGVNGIHTRQDTLYFTNTGLGIFGRMPVSSDGQPAGSPSVITHVLNSTQEFDDFALRGEDVYLVTGSGNSIERIGLDGTRKGRIIAGSLNATTIAEPTSCAFGRTPADAHVLYVVTAGGLATPVDGSIRVGAQVLAVDTRKWPSW